MRAAKRLTRFAAFSRSDRRLVLAATVTLLICRVRLLLRDTANLKSWGSRQGTGNASAERLLWAVEKASRLVPRATCLERALALQHLLSKNGHASELHVGAYKRAGRFTAHAWLTRGDTVLIGGEELAAGYEVLTVWPSTGRPLA